jgi:peptidoglycan/LPS O-acetylase OafA/YrhL
MQLKYYKNLDGVRAIAALMVMFFHFFRSITPSSKIMILLTEVSSVGQTGVTLFFVLSGFLITRILIRTKQSEGFFKNFYIRRTLRIFPLYYLFLILWYVIAPLFLVMESASSHQQFFYVTYLQGFARTFDWNSVGPHHFWSLAVEEHFYLFWPLIVYITSNKNLKYVISGIVLFAIIMRGFLLKEGYSVFLFTFTRIDSLAIGALLALMELKNFFRIENSGKFLILFAGMIVTTILIWILFSGEGNNYIQNSRYILLSFTYFAGIGYALSIKKNHVINKILKTSFLNYTGKISYGLYVFHPLVYLFCVQYITTENILLDFVIRFTLSYAIAALSYHYFESAFLRLKKYFEYKRKKAVEIPQSVVE